MESLSQDFQSIFERDLDQLIENIHATSEEDLWRVPKGVKNSCGVLVQHLVGNINHYIGKGIGEVDYKRQREREFRNTGVAKEKLVEEIQQLKNTLHTVFEEVEEEQLKEKYPLNIPFKSSKQGVLLHLYGHLNYHLGQANYLRRILSEEA